MSPVPVATHIFFEIACREDYLAAIQQEAITVLGAADWHCSRESIQKLTVLDSVCKETHMHHPTGAINLKKIINQDILLPNGIVLPRGTLFEVVILAANLSTPFLDRPEPWDGYRYHNLKQQQKPGTKAWGSCEWGVPTLSNLHFVYGPHMCVLPASRGPEVIETLVVKLTRRCDIRLEGGRTERYADAHWGGYIQPHLTGLLEVRAKSQSE